MGGYRVETRELLSSEERSSPTLAPAAMQIVIANRLLPPQKQLPVAEPTGSYYLVLGREPDAGTFSPPLTHWAR